jgi:hypothetical protein
MVEVVGVVVLRPQEEVAGVVVPRPQEEEEVVVVLLPQEEVGAGVQPLTLVVVVVHLQKPAEVGQEHLLVAEGLGHLR